MAESLELKRKRALALEKEREESAIVDEEVDDRSGLRKGFETTVKTLGLPREATKATLIELLGQTQPGDFEKRVNPLKPEQGGLLKALGASEAGKGFLQYHPMTAAPRLMAYLAEKVSGVPISENIENVLKNVSPRDAADLAIDMGLDVATTGGASALAKGLSKIPKAGKVLAPLVNIPFGTGIGEGIEKLSKSRAATKAKDIYEKIFADPQARLDVRFPDRELIPLAQQAQETKFEGSFMDFLNKTLPERAQKGVKGLETTTKAFGDAPMDPSTVLNRLKKAEQEILSTSRPDRFSESEKVATMRKEIEQKLMGDPTGVMPESVPASTMQKIKQDQMGYIYDTSPPEGPAGIGLSSAERAIMPIKTEIGAAYGPEGQAAYETANKLYESASPEIRKLLRSFATKQTERPSITQVDALMLGDLGKEIIENPLKGIPKATAAVLKKDIQAQKAFSNATSRAAKAARYAEAPASSMMSKAADKAALLNFLDGAALIDPNTPEPGTTVRGPVEFTKDKLRELLEGAGN